LESGIPQMSAKGKLYATYQKYNFEQSDLEDKNL
jgi:hypothetical protein